MKYLTIPLLCIGSSRKSLLSFQLAKLRNALPFPYPCLLPPSRLAIKASRNVLFSSSFEVVNTVSWMGTVVKRKFGD